MTLLWPVARDRPRRLVLELGPRFPEVPARPGGARRVVVGAAALVIGAAVVITRQLGRGGLDTLWAEDGTIFLQQELSRPTHQLLAETYAGYLHVLPRLVAALLSTLPLQWAAVGFGVAAATLTAAQAMIVYAATEGHLHTRVGRVAVASLVVVLPLARTEVVGVVANLQWTMLFTSFWVLLWNPRGRAALAVGVAVLVLTALSDPLTLCLAPLALVRIAMVADMRARVFPLALLGGLSLQTAASMLAGGDRALDIDPNVVRIGAWYGFDVIGRTAFGFELLGPGRLDLRSIAMLLGALCLVAVVVLLACRLRPGWPLFVAIFATGTSVALYVMPVFLAGLRTDRYAVTPSLLLLTAVVAVFDRCERQEDSSWRRWRALFLALLAVVVLLDFRATDRTTLGRSWSAEMSRAEERCHEGGADTVVVRTTPAGWSVRLPCGRL